MKIQTKALFLLFTVIIWSGHSFAQSRPGWTVKLPKTENSTYIYVCENAIAGLEKDARNQAMARVFQSTALRLGVPFDAQQVFDAVQKGTDLNVISRQFNIPIYKVCEYTERIGMNYKVYVLCQVAAQGNIAPQFDYSFRGCSDDHRYTVGSAIISSALLPGLGQMGKRHFGEGIATLTGEIVLSGGAVATYFMGKEKLEQMTSGKLSYDDYRSAESSYNTLHTANHILLGAAAALYAFNLFRAITLHPNYKETAWLAPSLIATPSQIVPTFGISLRF